MGKREFCTVDVFTDRKYRGNQLAVYMDGREYSDEEMQAITREMNYSETTFIIPPMNADGSYRVRIFTQAEEVPFAGHPTLGTAYIILRELAAGKPETVVLDLKVGKITVQVDYRDGEIARLTMQQKQPTFGATVAPSAIAAVLGLQEADIDTRYPVREVSTGLPFLIVPLKTLAAVKAIKLDKDKHNALFGGLQAIAPYAFCPETYHPENTLNARAAICLNNIVGEDPATGSAAGNLTAYLLKYNYFGKKAFAVSIEQGYEIGRESILYLTGALAGDQYEIFVGGQVVPVAQGRLIDWYRVK